MQVWPVLVVLIIIDDRMDYTNQLKSFCQELLRPIIVEAVKEAVPKELTRKEKRYYTRQEVCDMLHITPPTFYSYVSLGLIKKVKIEGRTLVDADEFDEAFKEEELVRYKHSKKRR